MGAWACDVRLRRWLLECLTLTIPSGATVRVNSEAKFKALVRGTVSGNLFAYVLSCCGLFTFVPNRRTKLNRVANATH